MRVLALDCSAKSVSVAIAENGKLIYEAFLNITLTHSETLMPMCEQALLNARCSLKDIDAIAITAGPGSFTGVRIGISAVKGMCFNDKKPVFAYSTLEAMALAFAGGGFNCTLCGLMDARREQFYNALFKIENGNITRLCEDRIITKNELEAELKSFNNDKIILAGDGALLFNNLCEDKTFFSLAPSTLLIQRACGIAIDASSENSTVSSISAGLLQPIYLRKSQAEREREAKLG